MFKEPSEEVTLNFLKSAEHFKEADNSVLVEVIKKAQWKAVPSRQMLVRQGESSQIFILYSGQLNYEKINSLGEIVAQGEFTSGEIVGEISFFRNNCSVANVFSTRNCLLMQLNKEDFESFLLKCPKALLSITRKAIFIADQSLNTIPSPKRYSSIALVPVDKELNIELFAQHLRDSLKKFGDTGYLSKKIVEEKIGTGKADINPNDPQFVEKISRLSRYTEKHDYLISEADYEPTAWSKAVTEEADRILLIARIKNITELSLLEKKLISERTELTPKFDLVILREEYEHPTQTLSHTLKRSVEHCHHIRIGNKRDYDRLARILTGNSIGLALGGGGVRAASQVGLLRAFQEADIPIDHICGTSIGSLVAGLYATGFSTDEMQMIVKEKVVNTNLFNDYTLPLVSLVKGKKFSKFLQDVFKDQLIEDMPIDYFSVATNLSKESLDTFTHGPAWKAVRASASLPAILPPYLDQNGLYVDGGLLDNLPGNLMRQRGAGKIIAVDVSSARNIKKDKNLLHLSPQSGSGPQLRKLMYNKCSKDSLDYTTIGEIISRSMVVGSRERSDQIKEAADLYIRMPVDIYGMLDFQHSIELIKLGYEYSAKNSEQWKQKLLID